MTNSLSKYVIATDDNPILVASGDIEVRLAQSHEEIIAGQKLRYKVFFEEMGARPSKEVAEQARDFDAFDDICDHLLAIDNSKSGDDRVVATYRLLREEKIDKKDDFYSTCEFDLDNLYSDHFRDLMGDRQLLELGRSCVKEDYRTNAVMHLMWKFIARYIDKHKIAYLFGCASLPGVDQKPLEAQLSYLYHYHKTPDAYNIPALADQRQKMNYFDKQDFEKRDARRGLAPLVKGYLNLGCYIGDGAVIDEQFGTTDVFILLPVDRLEKRYLSLFED
ncbi:GNAT family N-acetyltransferase [Pseudemcibacter aquimaris]|uniref:GNAT family N-acetyltransferase n=1 Tax=Pseudemcibacter aquimaris TaxID=2857064 RepID=UPI0020127FF1|nr:GNAT family N-acyltransferase [Pseudemcibacter aquimaris]MCC3862365.1 GNAT family N-acetyltransferase [Pseudemcibacter aquimaris]WDU59204.1 GNAT family N-acetyltransferase [Pseudemcibacter aquimaris]